MEFFNRAKTVRLKSQYNKFLIADEDEESVKQHANGASTSTRWIIEPVDGKPNIIRLKNMKSWKYLQASDDPFLLGLTGKRVVQASPRLKTDASVEWEPIKEGQYVKLRTRRGSFLRANGRIYPWRNSVTHDMNPEWILWIVDILEFDHTAEVVVEDGAELENTVVNDRPDPQGNLNNSYQEEEETINVYSDLSEGRTGPPSPPPKVVDALSRSSSTSSNGETPISSYAATPASSEPIEEVSSSPYIQKLKNNSFKNSKPTSFNNLDSIIADADKLLKKNPQQDPTLEPSSSRTSSRPLPLEIRMAKQTLIEAKDLDFETILTTNRLKRVEKAISVLSRTGNSKTTNLHEQFETMRLNREKAVADLEEYEVYGEKKTKMKEELQREVGKARELQRREEELCEVLEMARKRRAEIVRELERVEEEIKEAEEEQAKNEAEIEGVRDVIGRRAEGVKVMEVEKEEWQRRKKAAERRLIQVEDEWGEIKASLHMFQG